MTDQRPWLKNYPTGIPANINAEAYPCLVDFIEETFDKYRKKTAFACMGAELTFDELDKMSMQFAGYLRSRGLEVGDRIALMMPNMLQYPIALFGALRAGLIVVNTNPLYTPREMKHQFTDSECKAIVIAENFADNLQEVLGETKIKTIVVTSIGEMLGFFKGKIVNFVVRKVKRMVPAYEIANTVSFKEALKEGKKFKLESHKGNLDDVILHQYTGGTTGVAKGAMLTNKNLVANMQQIRSGMVPFLRDGEEVAIAPLPMYHIFAFSLHGLALMSIGSMSVLITNPRDIPNLIKEWKKYPVSFFSGVNTLFNALLNHKDFETIDFSPLKVSIGGGMAVQKPVAEKWQQVTGCFLAEGYGMTESSPVITVNPIDGSGRLGTIGMPVPSTEVRIADEHGIAQSAGEIGEIQVRGPQVMKGYYNRPDATAETIVGGWLKTGDIGVMSADGFFRIVDRKKNMIVVSGFNVYPSEIEEVLAEHPKVLESAAIGLPDEKSGEVVMIYVVKRDKSLTEKELIAFCRENLTGYKIPKHCKFIEESEMPKSTVGKILHRVLRERAIAEMLKK